MFASLNKTEVWRVLDFVSWASWSNMSGILSRGSRRFQRGSERKYVWSWNVSGLSVLLPEKFNWVVTDEVWIELNEGESGLGPDRCHGKKRQKDSVIDHWTSLKKLLLYGAEYCRSLTPSWLTAIWTWDGEYLQKMLLLYGAEYLQNFISFLVCSGQDLGRETLPMVATGLEFDHCLWIGVF